MAAWRPWCERGEDRTCAETADNASASTSSDTRSSRSLEYIGIESMDMEFAEILDSFGRSDQKCVELDRDRGIEFGVWSNIEEATFIAGRPSAKGWATIERFGPSSESKTIVE